MIDVREEVEMITADGSVAHLGVVARLRVVENITVDGDAVQVVAISADHKV